MVYSHKSWRHMNENTGIWIQETNIENSSYIVVTAELAEAWISRTFLVAQTTRTKTKSVTQSQITYQGTEPTPLINITRIVDYFDSSPTGLCKSTTIVRCIKTCRQITSWMVCDQSSTHRINTLPWLLLERWHLGRQLTIQNSWCTVNYT